MSSSDAGSVIGASGRERKPYRFNAVIEELRGLARGNDAEVERVIADFVEAYDDGVIEEREFRHILVGLFRFCRDNAQALNILDVLDESGDEAALRVVERGQARRRTTKVGAR